MQPFCILISTEPRLHNVSTPRTLDDWLAHCERIHPRTIELGLARVEEVRARLGLAFACPVITVAGTNGKGSTCAMLESILLHSGWRVGVYMSPHLVHFQERCRVRGKVVTAAELVPHFEAVEAVRGGVSLTYFEFTTLAILRLLSHAELDAVVLEVGLGGRLDAVNVIDADCAVITSVDLDHTDYLGPDRESIGIEKAGIMRRGRPVVVSDPQPPVSIAAEAERIGADLRQFGRDFNYAAQQGSNGQWQQWAWSGRVRRYSGLAYPALRGTNQLLNASGVLAALETLQDRLPVTAQGVRSGLSQVELPGRFQIVAGEPTLVLDVAHNPHAVAALAVNLDQMGYYPCTRAVLGVMADKDIDGIVAKMLPLVDHWYVCDLPTPRAASAAQLGVAIQKAHAGARQGGVIAAPVLRLQTHAGSREALEAALAEADPTDRIVVFGSFFTVGGVLAGGMPRTGARHLEGAKHPEGQA